ncbi:MAG TPA: glycosyltransferase, partial [Kofleriaceae bacterium]|nr:glycosyltransferase [Kofleriaceae bacterium]
TGTGRTEGMPMAALEAMAAGAGVVASSVGGLAELPVVTHVAPGDPAALAAAIDRLLASPGALADQVAAQARFVADYDWSRVGPRLDPVEAFRMNRNR